MEDIKVQYRVFSYEKIKLDIGKQSIYFYKNNFLPDVVNELAQELKNKSQALVNRTKTSKEKLAINSTWLNQSSELIRQSVVEFSELDHYSNNREIVLEVAEEYVQDFITENSQLVLYQAYLLEETQNVKLVLNFFIRFTYQVGEFIDSGMSEALLKQGLGNEGNILAQWKNREANKVKILMMEKYEHHQSTTNITKDQIDEIPKEVVSMKQQLTELDSSIQQVNETKKVMQQNLFVNKVEIDKLTQFVENIEVRKKYIETEYESFDQDTIEIEAELKQTKMQLVQTLSSLNEEQEESRRNTAKAQLTAKVVEINEDLNSLGSDVKKVVKVKRKIEENLKSNLNEMTDLTKLISNIDNRKKEIKSYYQNFDQEIQLLALQLQKIKKKLTATEPIMANKQVELDVKMNNHNLNEKFNSIDKELVELEQTMQDTIKINTIIGENTEKNLAKVQQLNTTLEEMENKKNQVTHTQAHMESEAKFLEKQFEEIQKKIKKTLPLLEIHDGKATIEISGKNLAMKAQGLNKALVDLESDVEKISQVKVVVEESFATNQAELNELTQLIADASQKKTKTIKNYTYFANETRQLNEQIEEMKAKLTEVIPSLQVEAQEFEKNQLQLTNLEQQVNELEKTNQKLEKILNHSMEKIKKQKDLQGQANLTVKLQQMTQEVEAAKKRETQLIEKIQQLETVLIKQNIEPKPVDEDSLNSKSAEFTSKTEESIESIGEVAKSDSVLDPIEENDTHKIAVKTQEDGIEEPEIIEAIAEKVKATKSNLWRRNKRLELDYFNDLYRKVQFIEHAWMVHLDLIGANDTNAGSEKVGLSLVDEELRNNLDKEDIKKFIYSGEALKLKERSTTLKLPFGKPTISLSTEDCELLIEKARQYDLLEYLNKRMVSS
ncbi:hypothetical protein ACWOFR_17405 [Carnobacterium gallinarum]|uniref:hypothetical protein n=1 Tax=Carnobacterium gallinarum TaxID=2749 RepID=UPI00054E8688|nr:hypothetical protein [Carnobacterium gallinarum]